MTGADDDTSVNHGVAVAAPEPPASALGAESDAGGDYVDDPEEFLPARRKRLGPLTVALALLLVAALGVFGGVQLQKHRGTTTTAAVSPFTGRAAGAGFGGFGPNAGATGGTGQAGATGAPGGTGAAGGQGGGATVGTIKLVDGDTIYVTTSDGNIVKVKTTAGSTTISRSVTGTTADLQPGQAVVVQGAADADGIVTATRVTEGGGVRAGG